VAVNGKVRNSLVRILAVALVAAAVTPLRGAVAPEVGWFDPPGETSVPGAAQRVTTPPTDPATEAANRTRPPTAWPKPGRAEVTVSAKGSQAGDLPIWLASPSEGTPPERVSVELLGSDAAHRIAPLAAVVQLTGKNTGRVQMTLDYQAFRAAAGGDFGARLTLVRLPNCLLKTDCRADPGEVP
jgi:hypothetical protein